MTCSCLLDRPFLLQLTPGSYLYLGKYERQVATELRLRMKGDGRLYLAYLKTDSYAEGEGTYDIWQTYLQLRCATAHCSTARLEVCC